MIKNILNRFKTNKAKQEVLSNKLSLSKQQRALKTEEVVKLVEDVTLQENPNLINQTKTLSRLDILETFSLWSTTNINELSGQQKINTSDIATLKNKVDSIETKKADFVLDTTDGQYKNVKSIIIDKATKADLLFDAKTQTYTTIDKVSVGNALLADNATKADYATTAGVANQIKYKNGVFHLDTIMSDYYTQDQIDKLLSNNKPTSLVAGNNIKIDSNDENTTVSTTDDIRVNNVEAKDGNITIKSINGNVLVQDNTGVISIRDLKTTQDNLIQEVRSKKPFTYKGNYVSTTTYQLNEIVTDKKKEFLSLQDNNTEPLSNKSAWVEFGIDGFDPENFYDKTQVDSQINTINEQIGGINTSVALKADKSYVDTQLLTKATLQSDNTFSGNNTFNNPMTVNNTVGIKTTNTNMSIVEMNNQSGKSINFDYIQPSGSYKNWCYFNLRHKFLNNNFVNLLKYEIRIPDNDGVYITTDMKKYIFDKKIVSGNASGNRLEFENYNYQNVNWNTVRMVKGADDVLLSIDTNNTNGQASITGKNGNLTISELAEPVSDKDAATKSYVDSLIKTITVNLNDANWKNLILNNKVRVFGFTDRLTTQQKDNILGVQLFVPEEWNNDGSNSYNVSFAKYNGATNELKVIVSRCDGQDINITKTDACSIKITYKNI